MKKSDLKFNIGALREFKELSGVSPFQLTNEELLDPDNFGALAFVGLKHGKYSDASEVPTREEIEETVSMKDLRILWESFAEWCNLKIEEETEEEKK